MSRPKQRVVLEFTARRPKDGLSYMRRIEIEIRAGKGETGEGEKCSLPADEQFETIVRIDVGDLLDQKDARIEQELRQQIQQRQLPEHTHGRAVTSFPRSHDPDASATERAANRLRCWIDVIKAHRWRIIKCCVKEVVDQARDWWSGGKPG